MLAEDPGSAATADHVRAYGFGDVGRLHPANEVVADKIDSLGRG
jgi:hypothetical protein